MISLFSLELKSLHQRHRLSSILVCKGLTYRKPFPLDRDNITKGLFPDVEGLFIVSFNNFQGMEPFLFTDGCTLLSV